MTIQLDPQLISPLSGSVKSYTAGNLFPNIRVPQREIKLSNGKSLSVYDTSVPFTDDKVDIDIHQGLPHVRQEWINTRNDSESYSSHILTNAGAQTPNSLYRLPRRAKNNQAVWS